MIASRKKFHETIPSKHGSVVDSSGAGVPGAKVNLLLPGGKAAILATETGSSGLFDFQTVRPGTYNLTVQHPGFARSMMGNVLVEPVRQTELTPIKLEIATAAQSLETSSFEVASTVTYEGVNV